MDVEVRPALPADIEGIQRVAAAAWHAAHEPIVGTEAVESFLEEFYDAASFEAYLDDETLVLAVTADAEGPVVGFVSLRPADDHSETFQLGRIYVAPERWGEGIGQRLLEFAEAAVRERNGDRITLGVMAENDRAIGFYEAAGYDRVDEFFDDRIDTPGYTYEKVW